MTPQLILAALTVVAQPTPASAESIRLNAAAMSCDDLAVAAGAAYTLAVRGADFPPFDASLEEGTTAEILAWQHLKGSPNQRTNAGASLRFIELFLRRDC